MQILNTHVSRAHIYELITVAWQGDIVADSLQSMFSPIGDFTKLAIKAFVFLSLDTLCKDRSMTHRGEQRKVKSSFIGRNIESYHKDL